METLKYGKILAVQKCLNAAVKGHTSPEQNRRNLVGLEDVSSAASSLKDFYYFILFFTFYYKHENESMCKENLLVFQSYIGSGVCKV